MSEIESGWLLPGHRHESAGCRTGSSAQEIVEQIHEMMCRELPIDRVEVCYDSGRGTPSEYRKPAPGMLLRASAELRIDLPQSYMVGDRRRDIDCGFAAGCQTIFIDNNYVEELRRKPDFRVTSLLEAAEIILNEDHRRN